MRDAGCGILRVFVRLLRLKKRSKCYRAITKRWAPGARTWGTIDPRAGDGIMLVFNAPLPCDVPAGEALDMALVMQKQMREYGAPLR
jgi:hypothetical protein